MNLHSVTWDGAYPILFLIPVVLARAVTVHRCQGFSLNAPLMNLALCSVCAMGYVAFSRVGSLESVYILSFNR